jgi:hypothetical protein
VEGKLARQRRLRQQQTPRRLLQQQRRPRVRLLKKGKRGDVTGYTGVDTVGFSQWQRQVRDRKYRFPISIKSQHNTFGKL